jgi:branched-chain amino acid transport system permease protein
MTTLLQLAIAGIALGCAYALVALGFTIIFKASGVINFAQGEFLLLGAFLVADLELLYHLDFFVALLIALVVTVLVGVLFERFVLRRMIGRPVFSILMITIGLQILLQQAVLLGFGPDAAFLPIQPPFSSPTANWLGDAVDVGGVRVLTTWMVMIAVTAILVALLFVFFRYTKYGLAMRATALDQEAALAMGVNVRMVNVLAWGIAAAVATIGGVLLTFNSSGAVSPLLDTAALLAFPAIILGGIDSIPGAVVGGVVIGLSYELLAGYNTALAPFVGNGFYSIAPYILMILILLIRPYGLFGTRKVERV